MKISKQIQILILILISTCIHLYLFLKLDNDKSSMYTNNHSDCIKELQSVVSYKDVTYLLLIVNLFTIHALDPFIEFRTMKLILLLLFILSWTYIIKAYKNYVKRNPKLDHSLSEQSRYTLRMISLFIDIYVGLYFFNTEKIPPLKYSIITGVAYNVYAVLVETKALDVFKNSFVFVKDHTYTFLE